MGRLDQGAQPPRYDAHADWYERYQQGAASGHTKRTAEALSAALGPGAGICLDVGCGTGVHAPRLRSLGWQVVGVDLSHAQLRHAVGRLPVAVADAAALPVRTASVDAISASLIHTDVDDWAAVVQEAARVLHPGGSFAYVVVHPCFVSPFAERMDEKLLLHPGYAESGLRFAGPGIGSGIRPKVGVWHRPLASVLNGVTATGLRIVSVQELGASAHPDLLVIHARR
ncbi:MAG: Methyltransferase type 11 [Frankiales bacterium]|jgi:SAM-dependent methyltransferase|nr:Methyltransferase type 11 [Frankiales bacterium]